MAKYPENSDGMDSVLCCDSVLQNLFSKQLALWDIHKHLHTKVDVNFQQLMSEAK